MATVIRKDQDLDWGATRAGSIGELLLRAGKLDEAAVARVLAAQRENGLRFGETAIKLGLLHESDVKRVLARQFDYPCVESDASDLDRALFAAYESSGAHVEALRRLRSELSLRCFKDKALPLAVFAPRGPSDASIIAANLAIAFAQTGERTLLIDANLRAPRQRELFALPKREGLSNLLVGRVPLSDALMPVPGFPHLSVLCAGTSVPNPQELLSRGGMHSLMEVVAVSFDVVIVDCAPALDYADAQLTAMHCGGCLVVARRDATRLADIEAIKAQLLPTGAQLVGAVMTQR
jgi:chain length determinant protein tyrosine kinase EpsG